MVPLILTFAMTQSMDVKGPLTIWQRPGAWPKPRREGEGRVAGIDLIRQGGGKTKDK